jgi:hypothetical protein
MANNRLYLQDISTGETLMLASTQGCGWLLAKTTEEIQLWLDNPKGPKDDHAHSPRDMSACNCGLPSTLRLIEE